MAGLAWAVSIWVAPPGPHVSVYSYACGFMCIDAGCLPRPGWWVQLSFVRTLILLVPSPIPSPHINLKYERMLGSCAGCSCAHSIPAPFLQPSYLKQRVTAILWSTLQTQALL